MPRYLPIPEDVQFKNLVTNEPIVASIDQTTKETKLRTMSFREFYLDTLSHDPRLATVKGARALFKFDQAYDLAVASNKVMVLDQDVWEFWKGIAECPKYQVAGPGGVQVNEGIFNQRGVGVMQLLPFLDAIINASDSPPKREKTEPEAVAG